MLRCWVEGVVLTGVSPGSAGPRQCDHDEMEGPAARPVPRQVYACISKLPLWASPNISQVSGTSLSTSSSSAPTPNKASAPIVPFSISSTWCSYPS